MDDSIEIPETELIGPDKPPRRSPSRKAVGQIVIMIATALSLGAALNQRAMIGANDISRWCAVWALLERGTYAIDECPWQLRTQDKVKLPEPFPPEGEEPVERFYSSKPPLLPTIIAGALWPVRQLTGVPLDATVTQERSQRTEVQSLDDEPPEDPERILAVYEDQGYRVVDVTSEDPVEWPAHALYFSAVVVLLNVVPLTIGLVLYARLLDRLARDDWAWFLSLAAAALGTNLLIFTTTLNNHTVAAWSGFFALYALFRIWEGARHWGYFATAGFFGAFCACNELPAAAFGVLLFLLMLAESPSKTLKAFVPAAVIPCAAFLGTLYLATGDVVPVYLKFQEKGPDSPYFYEGSYWNSPLATDALDEPKPVYLFHMLIGHHGIFSLTPIFLFSLWGLIRGLFGSDTKLRLFAALTGLLSVGIITFYVFKTNNYGGATQGMRWLFWLFPFWLILLPVGLGGAERPGWARSLSLLALGVSVMTVGYGLSMPWSYPWLLDFIEHLGLYELKR